MALDPPKAAPIARKASFAFYGRVSTEDNQDPESSRGWQMTRASALIEPSGGEITHEFFDIGESRSLPWQRRDQARLLLAELRNPLRGFNAVVIGEPHRAFYGNQFGLTMPVFSHFGVQLWVPELGGAVDPDNEAHELVMSVYGGMSKGERNRIRVRVRTAMAAQTELEGRFLGGRPPYGYDLIDLGPHPNPSKAAKGQQLRGLVRNPATSAVVERIFALYLAEYGIHAIAEMLNADGVPCPSAADPARNPHRSGLAWAKSAVRVILTNPRYTGFQVWNKQRSDDILLDVDDVALGNTSIVRWNPKEKWVMSKTPSHEGLVSLDTFEGVQDLMQVHSRTGTPHQRPHPTRHSYVFPSCVICSLCDRRMQGHYAHGVKYYRCRYAKQYAKINKVDHPGNVYIREDTLVEPIDTWLASAFSPTNINNTINAMAESQPEEVTGPEPEPIRQALRDCDAKLDRYRAALEAGADPVVVTDWITEVQAERAMHQRLLAEVPQTPRRLTHEEISQIVNALGDIAAVLRRAHPDDKAEVYQQLNLRLNYDPETTTVRADVNLGADRRQVVGVRGGT
ncbi:recombinase family protein [Actinoplanes lutulentus]|uniref:recombinase family protein n=1 Tax=Actinoplanes lutulentus TaxID=1287878 RepID=UPI001C65CD9E|nr:recombinase family protein [Actinoplanes lutulentus]